MTTMVSLADARATLSELVGRVKDHHQRIIITLHGRPAAALISLYDLESMEETLEVLGDPETMARLRASELDIAEGQVTNIDEVDPPASVA